MIFLQALLGLVFCFGVVCIVIVAVLMLREARDESRRRARLDAAWRHEQEDRERQASVIDMAAYRRRARR